MSPPAQHDRCPGLLRPFIAEDGALVRIRIPGGRVPVSTLAALLDTATRHGAPALQLTSRGNLQLRALPDPLPADLVQAVEATGLLPSASHERVRNILASPLARDLDDVVATLDAGLVADPSLAQLSGRFLFAVADETGSVLSEPYDLAWQSLGGDEGVLIAAGGRGAPVQRDQAAAALLDRAREFLACRGPASVWNVRDLPGDAQMFAGLVARPSVVASPLGPGPLGADLVAGVPLAFLTAEHVQALVSVTDDVVLTPWRSFVVPGGAAQAAHLAAAGLVTQKDSPWVGLSACTGSPGCARSQCNTIAVTTQVAARRRADGPAMRVVGCERRCGVRADDLVSVAPRDADDVLSLISREPAR